MSLRKYRLVPFFLVAACASLLAGCDEHEMQSQWRRQEVAIDGHDMDWQQLAPHFYHEKSRIIFSIMNDSDNLYVMVATSSNAAQMIMLRGGCTMWLDTAGGKKKAYGIQFPLKMDVSSGGKATARDHKPRGALAQLIADQNSIAIITPDQKDGIAMFFSEAEDSGIHAGLGLNQGCLVYELKIPLTPDNPWLPDHFVMGGNQIVGVGFESGKLDRPGHHKGDGSRGGGGAGGGKGKGGTGGMGRGGGSLEGSKPQSFALWFNVHLADPPSPS